MRERELGFGVEQMETLRRKHQVNRVSRSRWRATVDTSGQTILTQAAVEIVLGPQRLDHFDLGLEVKTLSTVAEVLGAQPENQLLAEV